MEELADTTCACFGNRLRPLAHCPPSARLCALYGDKGSDYAADSTDAHSLCEYKLWKALGMETTAPTEDLT